MIKRYLLLLFVLLGLSSCESTVRPSFEIMSETELAMYNASLPTDEQVICQDAYADWIGGSYRRIPKWCITMGALEDLQREWDDWARAGGTFNDGGRQPAGAADYSGFGCFFEQSH